MIYCVIYKWKLKVCWIIWDIILINWCVLLYFIFWEFFIIVILGNRVYIFCWVWIDFWVWCLDCFGVLNWWFLEFLRFWKYIKMLLIFYFIWFKNLCVIDVVVLICKLILWMDGLFMKFCCWIFICFLIMCCCEMSL